MVMVIIYNADDVDDGSFQEYRGDLMVTKGRRKKNPDILRSG